MSPKINNSALLQFANSKSNRFKVVSAELSIQKAKINQRYSIGKFTNASETYQPIPQSDSIAMMDNVEKELIQIGIPGSNIKRLDRIATFLIKVSPEMLRKVASIDSIQTIRPNLVHA